MARIEQHLRTAQSPRAPQQATPLRSRALLAGLLLAFANAYWVVHVEAIDSGWGYTTFALLPNAVATLLVLVPTNLVLTRLRRGWALTKAELLLVYAMVMIASGIAGWDWAEALPSVMSYTARLVQLGTDARAAQVQEMLPASLVLPTSADLTTMYVGGGSLYDDAGHWQPWLRPLALWTLFLGLLVSLSIAVSTLLRKQWIAHERLSFPLLALPIALCEPRAPLLRNRLFWLGVAVAGMIDLLSALSALYPSVPAVHLRTDVPIPAQAPWNSLAPMTISLAPVMVGICWFAPTALQFSVWVFFLLHKLEILILAALGYTGGSANITFVDLYQQAAGGMLALAAISIYSARHHLRAVARLALASGGAEARHYRAASLTALGSAAGLLFFTTLCIGIPVALALALLAIYIAAYIGLARVRAELGPPMNGLYAATPVYLFTEVLGSRLTGMRGYTGINLLWWIDRDAGQHPLAHSMEGMKLATEGRAPVNVFAVGMLLAAIVGFVSAVWLILHCSHELGLEAKMTGIVRGTGVEVYRRQVSQVSFPAPVSGPRLGLFLAGGGFVGVLATLRARFFGFPLHPVGFVLANIWGNFWTFAPFLLAWLMKVLTLRYGGLQSYRRFSFLFMGLVAGECVMSVSWLAFQIVTGHKMPPFFP